MSDIDKILKEAVEGYEAPYDASIWDNISSQLSPMEDAFRESVNGHEAPYDPSAWSAIKNQIGSSSTLFQWIAGSAAAVTLVVGAISFIPANDSTPVERTAATKIESNTPTVLNENLITENNTNTDASTPFITNDIVDNAQTEENSTIVDNNAEASDEHIINNSDLQDNNASVDQTDHNSEPADVSTAVAPVVTPADENTETIVDSYKYSAEFTLSTDEVCAGEKNLV